MSSASFNNPKSIKHTEYVNGHGTNNKEWYDPFNDRKLENLIYKENKIVAGGGEGRIYRNNNP